MTHDGPLWAGGREACGHLGVGDRAKRLTLVREGAEEVYRAYPFLTEGEESWNTNTSEMPDGEYEVCGRLGAAGSVWRIIVL